MKAIILILITTLSFSVFGQTDQAVYDKNGIHHEWSYSGEYGPTHWSEIDPGYADCNGIYQSPININTKESNDATLHLKFHYHPFFVDLINNGHTLIEKIVEPKALEFNNKNYSLLQFHFHTPSEHHVDDNEFPMEIHFVHQSPEGIYAVVAVLVKEGQNENHFLTHFMKSLPTHYNEEIRTNEKADPIETFPKHLDRFYYYNGSFTTPPCTEGVHWIIMEEVVEATNEQIESIHKIIKEDNRPVQKINNRLVFHSGSLTK
ncbi:MAG: carbonic anhydrase family protein [Reichenbachiella sp.]